MKLLRRYYEDRTEGKIVYPDDSYTFSLERSWLNNKPFVSCIPEGRYLVKKDNTGKHQWYSVTGVKNRSFIEIHPANHVDQLEGCIAPCNELVDGCGVGSRNACQYLHSWFGDNSFWLEIIKYNPFKHGKWKEDN